MSRRVLFAAVVAVAAGAAALSPGPAATAQETAEHAAPSDSYPLLSNKRGTVEVPLVDSTPGGIWMVPSRRGTGPRPESAPSTAEAVPADALVRDQGRLSPESVIGPDGRRPQVRTTTYPNRAIAHLQFDQSPGGIPNTYLCSAFLVDRNTLLTSGHCVHEGGTGLATDFSTNMFITLGRGNNQNTNAAPFGTCRPKELLTTPTWIDRAGEAHDIGIIQMANCSVPNPGRQTGWFGYFAVRGQHALRDLTAIVRGYPGLPPTGFNGTLWSHAGRIRQSRWEMAFYRMDTSGGMSGSPVYEPGRFWCGACAMAVHGYGIGHGSFPHTDLNHGPRITVDRFQAIRAIAAQNN